MFTEMQFEKFTLIQSENQNTFSKLSHVNKGEMSRMLRPVKINVLFLIRKKKSKKGEGKGCFKTEKMTIDHAYNEQTETVQEYSWDILNCQQTVCV